MFIITSHFDLMNIITAQALRLVSPNSRKTRSLSARLPSYFFFQNLHAPDFLHKLLTNIAILLKKRVNTQKCFHEYIILFIVYLCFLADDRVVIHSNDISHRVHKMVGGT